MLDYGGLPWGTSRARILLGTFSRARIILGNWSKALNDCLQFFFSGAMSFVLYMLVFLRLRGNFVFTEGSRLPKFIWVPRAKAWKLQANRDAVDAHMTDVAKQMIWFPVAYTIVIIPITFGRFLSNAGSTMTFEWYIFADAFFMSSGKCFVCFW